MVHNVRKTVKIVSLKKKKKNQIFFHNLLSNKLTKHADSISNTNAVQLLVQADSGLVRRPNL